MDSSGRYVFVSDLHLGPETDPGCAKERSFVSFLKSLPSDVKGLFLLGDVFDFWVEYRDVVPRGNVRALAAIAEAAERMEVWFFGGNHDWWMRGYFEEELGVHVVKEPFRVFELGGIKVLAGHGDTVGKRDWRARFIAGLFRNRVCIAMLKALHPRWVFGFARRWASFSRKKHTPPPFAGKASPLYVFADEYGRSEHIDHYVFGHWHCHGRIDVESGGELHQIGAWDVGQDNYLIL